MTIQNPIPENQPKEEDYRESMKDNEDVFLNNEHVLKNDGHVPQNDGKVPQNDGKVPQNDGKVPQNDGHVPQNDGKVPQNDGHVPQNDGKVPQNDGNVPQNVKDKRTNSSLNINNDLQKHILEKVKNNSTITRGLIAKELGISIKTVARYLSRLNIIWDGSSKGGHWCLPKDLQ